jgi:hypothetical protein
MTHFELHGSAGSGRHHGSRKMERWSPQIAPSRGKCSADEKAQLDSLNFHLDGFKTSLSQAGKLISLRKVYEILQASHHSKRDYFGLPSLANFWRDYHKLQLRDNSTINAEILFWLHALAILVLFKDTKSTEINIPPYAMTVLEALINIALLQLASPPQGTPKGDAITAVSIPKIIANTFGTKRKFSSSASPLLEDRPKPMETELPYVSFATKRKLSESMSPCQVEAAPTFSVEIKRDDIGSISALWSSLAELLRLGLQGEEARYDFQSENVSVLNVFVINRYLHFLISIGALCEEEEESSQDNSLQLQQILDHLRSSDSLGRVSSSVMQLIEQEFLSEEPSRMNRTLLWCNLGILESACFRNTSNQVWTPSRLSQFRR